MTKTERIAAQRHKETLEHERDTAWREAVTSQHHRAAHARHAALEYAVRLVDRDLASATES